MSTTEPATIPARAGEEGREDAVALHKGDAPIRTLDDWATLAPPRKKRWQWKKDRSAYELAAAWTAAGEPRVPPELAALLRSHPDTADLTLREGEPEARVRLDAHRGEARNTDLLLFGEGRIGPVAVSVEAKADESFGTTIAYRREVAGQNPRSAIGKRIATLVEGVFGPAVDAPALEGLRYQLLHAAAAALIAAGAHGARAAVFVVHELRSQRTREVYLARNARDLDHFAHLLSGGAARAVTAGELLGPFRVPGGGLIPPGIPLYVGKAVRTVAPPPRRA